MSHLPAAGSFLPTTLHQVACPSFGPAAHPVSSWPHRPDRTAVGKEAPAADLPEKDICAGCGRPSWWGYGCGC